MGTGKKSVESNMIIPESSNQVDEEGGKKEVPVDSSKEEVEKKIEESVDILSVKIEKDIIGTPNLIVSLKNNTDKVIDGINIEARFLNNFNDPVKGIEFDDKPFGGTSQRLINPGETVEVQWMLVFYDGATKVDYFKITRVHFEDGEDWNIE